MEYPGVFCTEHLIYLAVFALISVISLPALKRFVTDKKKERTILRIAGIVLLICISVNRRSVTAAQIQKDPEVYGWINLIPYTFCGFASLATAIAAIFGRDDNPAYHFLVWFGLAGGAASVVYPDFLFEQTFWDLRSFSGLVHHSVLLWICLFILLTGRMKPVMKKYVFYPAGFALMMLLGFFEIYVLGFPEAMNIDSPLLSSLPVLTSWYSLFILTSLLVLAVYLICGLRSAKREGQTGNAGS